MLVVCTLEVGVELLLSAEVQDWVELPAASGEPLASSPCIEEGEGLRPASGDSCSSERSSSD